MTSPRELKDLASLAEAIGHQSLKYTKVLEKVWDDLGIIGDGRYERRLATLEHVVNLFKGMADEENRHKLVIVNKIEQGLKEAKELATELDLPSNQDTVDNDRPLYQVEATIREILQRHKKLKESRLEVLDDLLRRDEEVSVILGIEDQIKNGYPEKLSLEKIETYRMYVERKEAEREHLSHIFLETRSAILNIMKKLEIEPGLAFEKELMSASGKTFKLTSENMELLKKLHQSMERRLADAHDEATEISEKLTSLWEIFEVSGEDRAAFMESYGGCSRTTINALKSEVKRFEELRAANIAVFIKKLRSDLVELWDMCKISEEERAKFYAFSYDQMSEDIFEMHELEVNKLKQYYEDNRHIFKMAGKREELWKRMEELDLKASDKSRFKNRGGQLLQEERERKLIRKALPKIEEELLQHLENYELRVKCPFLWHGYNLADLIRNQWDERIDNKETQKLHRKIIRNNQLEVESKLGTIRTPTSCKKACASYTQSMLRPLQATATCSVLESNLKRRACEGPSSSVKKRRSDGKASGGKISKARYSVSKSRRFGKGGSRAVRTLHSSQTSGGRKPRKDVSSGAHESIVPSTYTEFQDQLEVMSAKKTCRSSVVPQRCLRERNAAVSSPTLTASVASMRKLTPARLFYPSQVDHGSASRKFPQVVVTPAKPPRRIATDTPATRTPKSAASNIRRTSTRLSMKSPACFKSPGPTCSSKLTTPRGRLPIII